MPIVTTHRLQQLAMLTAPHQQQTGVPPSAVAAAEMQAARRSLAGAKPIQAGPPGSPTGVSDALIHQLLHRVAVLEAEAQERRRFDEIMLRNLQDVSTLALETERLFSHTSGQLTIKAGDASIVLKADGTISIKGKTIDIKGTNIDIKGTGNVKIMGPKVSQN